MKGHVKRAVDTLEALGFTLDVDASVYGKKVYRHAYEPDMALKVWAGASEPACIAVIHKANAIAQTGSRGPAMPKSIGERTRIKKARARAERERENTARNQRAERAEQEHQARVAVVSRARHHREIQALMQPGYGH